MGARKLTGNPAAILSSEIVFVPARRLTFPVKVKPLFSLLPNADPTFKPPSYNFSKDTLSLFMFTAISLSVPIELTESKTRHYFYRMYKTLLL